MCLTALLIGLFVARPLIKRMFAPNCRRRRHGGAGQFLARGRQPARARRGGAAPPLTARPAALPAPNGSIDISRIDGQVRESSIKKVGEVVTAHPEEALAIIRTWLHQPV